MKNRILLLCLLSFNLIFSQNLKQSAYWYYTINHHEPKAEIINQSGFQHDYLIGTFNYLEDKNDTSKLKYIATLKITDKTFHYTGILARWVYNGFYQTARKLGGNTFYLKGYEEKDSLSTVIINIYFAGNDFLKINKLKADKNNIYLYGAKDDMKDSVTFYLNDSIIKFNSNKHLLIKGTQNINYNLSLTKDTSTNILVNYSVENTSRYFIVPRIHTVNNSNKNRKYNERINRKYKTIGVSDVLILRDFIGYSNKFYKGGDKMIELPYECGKLMSEIFK
jgi:hypothetical protein